jgi:probable rRNA maturation factor
MKRSAPLIDINIKRGLGFVCTRPWLKSIVKQVLDEENIEGRVSVDLLITDDRQIHKMNRQYRGIDRPTDVLSFALNEKGADAHDIEFPVEQGGVNNLGEIIISYPRVIEQAGEHNVAVEDELTLLITHGMLHLLGYNHEEDADSRKMRRREKSIIAAINRSGEKK